jgi:hypothetical protein
MAAASGISIKYPSDWQVIVGSSKAYAWEIVDKTDTKSGISVRSIDLSAPYATESPKQEWEPTFRTPIQRFLEISASATNSDTMRLCSSRPNMFPDCRYLGTL